MNATALISLMAFFLGTIVGSFLNVCIFRLPLKQSIVYPASHCTSCNKPLRFYDNIPLISYLVLGGKCRWCKAPISPQYPLVELLSGFLFALSVIKFGISWSALIYASFLASLIVVFFIDFAYMIIPDKISLPGIVIGFLASLFKLVPITWDQSLIGILVAGGFLYAVAIMSVVIFKKEGMGGGDIKLGAMMGAFMGWGKAFLGILLGSIIGSLMGIALILIGRKKRHELIPFGPSLVIGAIVALFWGDSIIKWYFSLY